MLLVDADTPETAETPHCARKTQHKAHQQHDDAVTTECPKPPDWTCLCLECLCLQCWTPALL